MQVQTRGEFGGLGIEVTQEEGFVKVVSPIDGTPASDAGIESGDFITHVDGESVLGLTLDEAVDMMRGPVGSEIVITVVREGEDEPFDVTIVRDTIKLTAVRTRTEGDTVVLRITTFNDQTYPNLEEGLQKADRGGWRHGQDQRLRARPAQQPRRPADPGDPGVATRSSRRARSSRTRGRDTAGRRTLQRDAGRPGRGQADRRADQRRLGLGLAKSSPARCRIIAAPSSSAPRASARGRSRPSCRCAATVRCA